jgi:hypothetical protein
MEDRSGTRVDEPERAGLQWSTELIDPQGGEVICHNDVCPESVVYRDGEAVALLILTLRLRGRRVYDLAQLVKMCLSVGRPGICFAGRTRGLGPVRASPRRRRCLRPSAGAG